MPFLVKLWQNLPAGGTRLNAAALRDLEGRLSDYTDEQVAAAGAAVAAEAATRAAGDSTVSFSTHAASYQPVLADAGTVCRMDSADDLDFTLPNDATVDYPLESVVGARRCGTGAVNIKKMAGVIIKNRIDPTGVDDRTIPDQLGEVSFHKVAPNTYEAVGDLA